MHIEIRYKLTIKIGRHVAIVDFSFSALKMQQMISEAASLIVLDHHASAARALSSIPDENKLFEMGQSGCTLSWNFFHPDSVVPALFRYVEDRDIWRWSMQESKAFDAAWTLVPRDFESIRTVLEGGQQSIADLISTGHVLLQYRNRIIDRHVDSAVHRR